MSTESLVKHLKAFVGFARSRTGDPELAADLVQECLKKALESTRVPNDEEGVVIWFYRVLRHAIIDAHRREMTRNKSLEKLKAEWPETIGAEDETSLCQCVMELLPTLPPEDADLLKRVDLEGESPAEIAKSANERVNTINVRLYRARRKLREQVERTCRVCASHGCIDCDCD